VRLVKDDPDRPPNQAPSIEDCRAHRCKDHFAVPALNASEADGAECGACIAEELAFVEREQLWPVLDILAARLLASSIRKEHLQRCIDRLNFLAKGAGDQMLEELSKDFQRRTLRRQWIDGKHDKELRDEWLKLPADHPAHQMALAIEREIWQEGANRGGSEHHEDGADPGAGRGEAVRAEPEEDPGGGAA
jgi:hypothetical protein